MVKQCLAGPLQLCLVLLCLAPAGANAGLFNNNDFNVFLDYACLNIDGIPIPSNSTLSNQCCGGNASAHPICNSGFFSILPDALDQTDASLDLAFFFFFDTIRLNENPSNLNSPPEPGSGDQEEPSTSSGSILSSLSALLSGGQVPIPAKNPPSQSASLSGGSSGSGTQTGVGGISSLGGMGSGDSLWNSKRRGKKSSAGTSTELSEIGGKYSSKGSFRDAVPESIGPSEVSSGHEVEVVEYPGGKNGASASGSDETKEGALATNGEAGAEGLEGSGAGEDGDLANSGTLGNGEGSSEDAPDYLKRIHKKDSIFKIVSRRYAREESRKNIGLPKARPVKR